MLRNPRKGTIVKNRNEISGRARRRRPFARIYLPNREGHRERKRERERERDGSGEKETEEQKDKTKKPMARTRSRWQTLEISCRKLNAEQDEPPVTNYNRTNLSIDAILHREDTIVSLQVKIYRDCSECRTLTKLSLSLSLFLREDVSLRVASRGYLLKIEEGIGTLLKRNQERRDCRCFIKMSVAN